MVRHGAPRVVPKRSRVRPVASHREDRLFARERALSSDECRIFRRALPPIAMTARAEGFVDVTPFFNIAVAGRQSRSIGRNGDVPFVNLLRSGAFAYIVLRRLSGSGPEAYG